MGPSLLGVNSTLALASCLAPTAPTLEDDKKRSGEERRNKTRQYINQYLEWKVMGNRLSVWGKRQNTRQEALQIIKCSGVLCSASRYCNRTTFCIVQVGKGSTPDAF